MYVARRSSRSDTGCRQRSAQSERPSFHGVGSPAKRANLIRARAGPVRVLFVCTGNICRSPTAEGVLRHLAKQAGVEVHVESAGTGDWHVGQPPDERAQHHARGRGYDLSAQRARQVARRDFEAFDLIVAMDRGHLAALQRAVPAASITRSCACSCPGATCPTRITAGPRASSACWTWWRPPAPASCAKLPALLPSLDLLQLVFLRRRLRPLAARAAELLRLLAPALRPAPCCGRSRSSPGPSSPAAPWGRLSALHAAQALRSARTGSS